MLENILIATTLIVSGTIMAERTARWLRAAPGSRDAERKSLAAGAGAAVLVLTSTLFAIPKIPLIWDSTLLLAVSAAIILGLGIVPIWMIASDMRAKRKAGRGD